MVKTRLQEFKRDLETVAIMGRTSYARKAYYKWRHLIDKRHKPPEEEDGRII